MWIFIKLCNVNIHLECCANKNIYNGKSVVRLTLKIDLTIYKYQETWFLAICHHYFLLSCTCHYLVHLLLFEADNHLFYGWFSQFPLNAARLLDVLPLSPNGVLNSGGNVMPAHCLYTYLEIKYNSIPLQFNSFSCIWI